MVRLPSAIRIAGCATLLLTASVPTLAQSAETKSAEYAAVLQQIADQKILIEQRKLFLEKQKQEIAFLQGQINSVGEVSSGVDEMLLKMAAQTERAVNDDLPFLREERMNRVEKLRADIENAEIGVGQKYRSALSALKIEVNYGFGVESYTGERPLNDGETPVLVVEMAEVEEGDEKVMRPVKRPDGTVNEIPEFGSYLRYGRMALVYLNDAATFARRYDPQSKAWVDLSAGDLNDVRRAVRISKGQSAPAVVTAPVYKSE